MALRVLLLNGEFPHHQAGRCILYRVLTGLKEKRMWGPPVLTFQAGVEQPAVSPGMKSALHGVLDTVSFHMP